MKKPLSEANIYLPFRKFKKSLLIALLKDAEKAKIPKLNFILQDEGQDNSKVTFSIIL